MSEARLRRVGGPLTRALTIIQPRFDVLPMHARQNEAAVRQLLRRPFRPEFLNRTDEVVIFHRLTRDDLARIVEIQLERVARRMQDALLVPQATPAAIEYLAQAGYDPAYGARPLKRAIQRQLQDPLALRLLQGEFRRSDTLRLGADDTGLMFTPVVVGESVTV